MKIDITERVKVLWDFMLKHQEIDRLNEKKKPVEVCEKCWECYYEPTCNCDCHKPDKECEIHLKKRALRDSIRYILENSKNDDEIRFHLTVILDKPDKLQKEVKTRYDKTPPFADSKLQRLLEWVENDVLINRQSPFVEYLIDITRWIARKVTPENLFILKFNVI